MTHPDILSDSPDEPFALTPEQLGRRFEFLTKAFRSYLGYAAVCGARGWKDPIAETDPYFNFIDESLSVKRAEYAKALPLSNEEIMNLQSAHAAAYLGEDPEQGGFRYQQEFSQRRAELVAYTQECLNIGDISSLVTPETTERMQQIEAMFDCLHKAGCSEQHAYITVMTAIGARTRADMGIDVGLTERGVRGAINYSLQKIKAEYGEDAPILAVFKKAFARARIIERTKRKKPPTKVTPKLVKPKREPKEKQKEKQKPRRQKVKPVKSAAAPESSRLEQLTNTFDKAVFMDQLLGRKAEASEPSETELLQRLQAGQAARQQIEAIDSPPDQAELERLRSAMDEGEAAFDRLVELHQNQVGLALRSHREAISDAGIASSRRFSDDATEALRQAIQHYTPGQEMELSDYVKPWINQAIQTALDRHEQELT